MSPRDAAAHAADRASLSIRELKFSGVGRWLSAVALVAASGGSGAFLGMGYAATKGIEVVPATEVSEAAADIKHDIRDMRNEQKAQGERLARVEALLDEIRRLK